MEVCHNLFLKFMSILLSVPRITNRPANSDFYWQDGYGIFSVNPTETDIVVKYIENQQEHHKKITFKDEFRAFLKKYNVEYDERYVWD